MAELDMFIGSRLNSGIDFAFRENLIIPPADSVKPILPYVIFLLHTPQSLLIEISRRAYSTW